MTSRLDYCNALFSVCQRRVHKVCKLLKKQQLAFWPEQVNLNTLPRCWPLFIGFQFTLELILRCCASLNQWHSIFIFVWLSEAVLTLGRHVLFLYLKQRPACLLLQLSPEFFIFIELFFIYCFCSCILLHFDGKRFINKCIIILLGLFQYFETSYASLHNCRMLPLDHKITIMIQVV